MLCVGFARYHSEPQFTTIAPIAAAGGDETISQLLLLSFQL
jgi:hypothetical protein